MLLHRNENLLDKFTIIKVVWINKVMVDAMRSVFTSVFAFW